MAVGAVPAEVGMGRVRSTVYARRESRAAARLASTGASRAADTLSRTGLTT